MCVRCVCVCTVFVHVRYMHAYLTLFVISDCSLSHSDHVDRELEINQDDDEMAQ